MIARSAKEALSLGEKTYQTGKPCKNGHVGERRAASGNCIACHNDYAKSRRISHPIEKTPENLEKERLRQANYRKENIKKVRKATLAWYHENKERAAAAHKEWRANNPALANLRNHRRRARLLGAVGEVTQDRVSFLLGFQGESCWGCCAFFGDTGYHIDHIVPLAKGGSNCDDNIQLLCPRCNQSKGAKSMDEWIEFMREQKQ